MSDKIKLPEDIWFGSPLSMTIGEIVHSFFKNRDKEDDTYDNPLGKRTVCGFVIPDWQRPIVWTKEQNFRFIDSIWRGVPLGTYSLNRRIAKDFPELQNIIIDGQQRLNAIESYLKDEIEIYGGYYSDLTKGQKNRFDSRHFTRLHLTSIDEKFIKDYYNLMNFSGTEHTKDQKV